ncbi:MAG TPA: peptide-methionine (S)-S-oxide reductase MsrA [Nitrospiria bacterium]
MMNPGNRETATLGGGCFWCLEAVYLAVQGVEKVVSGYTGGTVPDPNYRMICTGTTGHAEVVQLTFDPEMISFKEILEIFFVIHDPTTLNRQGADAGTQYRSVVFFHDGEQKAAAERMIKDLEAKGVWPDPIVTEVAPLDVFYAAEDYHQNYFERNPEQGYCQAVISPKLAKFRKHFASRLKS